MKPKAPKPKTVAKVTTKKANRNFTQYPKAGDAPQGIRVIQHEDYYAELEADRLNAGSDWNDSAKEWLTRFQEGRG